jgi:hypothetical protein
MPEAENTGSSAGGASKPKGGHWRQQFVFSFPSSPAWGRGLPASGGAEVYLPSAAPKATRGDQGRGEGVLFNVKEFIAVVLIAGLLKWIAPGCP